MSFLRWMLHNAASRHVETTDARVLYIVLYDVFKVITAQNLKGLKALGLNEAASKPGYNYFTVFIALERSDKPVVFSTLGNGKGCRTKFCAFIEIHEGSLANIVEVVCGMSPTFLSAAEQKFKSVSVTVDWFHVVQIFIKAVDSARKFEAMQSNCWPHPLGRTQGRRDNTYRD